MSKSERAAQALAKRKAEVDAQKEAEKALAKASLKPQPSQPAASSSSSASRKHDPYASRHPPSGPRGHPQPPQPPRGRPPPPPPAQAATPAKRPHEDESLPVVDQEAIKARYLGAGNEKKKRTRKQNDKKFNFDWDQEDDTGLGEVDPLYQSLQKGGAGQSGVLFGRGRLAGYSDMPDAAPAFRPNSTNTDP